jgi:hypothetical protein
MSHEKEFIVDIPPLESTTNENMDSFHPFMRKDFPLSICEWLKIIFLFPLIPIRWGYVTLALIGFWCISTCISCKRGSKYTYRDLKGCDRWCYSLGKYYMRFGLCCVGFCWIKRRNLNKRDDPVPCIIVSNHVSLLDVAFVISEFGIQSFVAMVSNLEVYSSLEVSCQMALFWYMDETSGVFVCGQGC